MHTTSRGPKVYLKTKPLIHPIVKEIKHARLKKLRIRESWEPNNGVIELSKKDRVMKCSNYHKSGITITFFLIKINYITSIKIIILLLLYL